MEHCLLVAKEPLFWIFRGWKTRSFLIQKVNGNIVFPDDWIVLVLIFLGVRNRVFFDRKSWWKDDFYWLLKSSCFELFGDGKYGLFLAKKLMKRWYLLGLFELSMIFQDLGNMVLGAVRRAKEEKTPKRIRKAECFRKDRKVF